MEWWSREYAVACAEIGGEVSDWCPKFMAQEADLQGMY
jgi:hypothetical protein